MCKLVVLGDSGVGKTTLINYFVNEEYNADLKATLGVDFSSKTINVNNRFIDLQIWDTAGDVRFHAVSFSFYRGANACILVYDSTSVESFHNLSTWKDDLFAKGYIDDSEVFPILVFANKCDLTDNIQVTENDKKQWINETSIPIIEVSARTGLNIQKGFEQITKLYLDNENISKSIIPITLQLEDKKSNSCNC